MHRWINKWILDTIIIKIHILFTFRSPKPTFDPWIKAWGDTKPLGVSPSALVRAVDRRAAPGKERRKLSRHTNSKTWRNLAGKRHRISKCLTLLLEFSSHQQRECNIEYFEHISNKVGKKHFNICRSWLLL